MNHSVEVQSRSRRLFVIDWHHSGNIRDVGSLFQKTSNTKHTHANKTRSARRFIRVPTPWPAQTLIWSHAYANKVLTHIHERILSTYMITYLCTITTITFMMNVFVSTSKWYHALPSLVLSVHKCFLCFGTTRPFRWTAHIDTKYKTAASYSARLDLISNHGSQTFARLILVTDQHVILESMTTSRQNIELGTIDKSRKASRGRRRTCVKGVCTICKDMDWDYL